MIATTALAQLEEDAAEMPRSSLFNSPLLLGFDHFERALDRVQKSSGDGYPPYNVEYVGDNRLRITLAVAGFRPEDLQVQVEDTQLVIRGKQSEDDEEDDRVFLHRGIAARQFQRSFVLAEGIEVKGAFLDSGLLHIDLERPEQERKVRTVRIETGSDRPQDVGGNAPGGAKTAVESGNQGTGSADAAE